MYAFETFCFLVDDLDGAELLDDGVVLGQRDVLDVDHHLIEGNVVVTA